jgi:hypothetical protein
VRLWESELGKGAYGEKNLFLNLERDCVRGHSCPEPFVDCLHLRVRTVASHGPAQLGAGFGERFWYRRSFEN